MSISIHIQLLNDWNDTVKVVFAGSGYPLPDNMSGEEIGIAYYMQTAQSEEEAARQQQENAARLKQLQETILEHFESVILPDIRKRTGYNGDDFSFKWAYTPQGEQIFEQHSQYRIPL